MVYITKNELLKKIKVAKKQVSKVVQLATNYVVIYYNTCRSEERCRLIQLEDRRILRD